MQVLFEIAGALVICFLFGVGVVTVYKKGKEFVKSVFKSL